MKPLLRVVLPWVLSIATPNVPLFAPTFEPVCYDMRPVYVKALAKAIARRESCRKNVGCLRYVGQSGAHRGRGNYAEWASDAESMEALERHIWRREDWTVGEIVKRFNPANDRYEDLVLSGTGLDAGLRIAGKSNCKGD